MQQPTPGRIVNFVVDEFTAAEFNDRGDGSSVRVADVLPAMIVRACSSDIVNLRVFRDALTDAWVTSVSHSARPFAPRSWHWPQRS